MAFLFKKKTMKSKGLMTPRKYLQHVEKTQRRAATGQVASIVGGIVGVGVSLTMATKLGHDPRTQMMAGVLGGFAALGIGYLASTKMEKIGFRTLAEADGRPKIAEMLAKRYEKEDPEFARKLRRVGTDAKKLNEKERQEYVDWLDYCASGSHG